DSGPGAADVRSREPSHVQEASPPMQRKSLPLALGLAGTALLGSAGSAAAAPNAIPPGYTRVATGNLTAHPGTQTRGSVSCPAGTVPFGGSVFVFSTSLLANVNSSFPFLNGWAADVNNGSGSDMTFEVTVICGTRPKNYAVVETNPAANPSASHVSAVAKCPA